MPEKEDVSQDQSQAQAQAAPAPSHVARACAGLRKWESEFCMDSVISTNVEALNAIRVGLTFIETALNTIKEE